MRHFRQLTIFDAIEDYEKQEAQHEKKSATCSMMKQFEAIKKEYPDALLLFRCGDFYEAYAQDAIDVSKILNLTLTHRSNWKEANDVVELAGFPFHALDTYLPRLVRAGKRVAICDQLENPKSPMP